jgi:DNA-binding NtrC family response regulator
VTNPLASKRSSWPVGSTSGFRRIILLVESDPDLASVIDRALGRGRSVVIASSISRAMQLLSRDSRIHSVVTSYQLSDGTAAKLLGGVKRRWPHVRRVLYADPARARARAKALADVVVDTAEPFDVLSSAVE